MCEKCEQVEAVLDRLTAAATDGTITDELAREFTASILEQARAMLTEALADLDGSEPVGVPGTVETLGRCVDTLSGVATSAVVNARTISRIALHLRAQKAKLS